MVHFCLAADGMHPQLAYEVVREVGPRLYAVKIHKNYDKFGPRSIHDLKKAGAKRVFVDDKIHDIPSETAGRVKALVENGADIITVHAAGGMKMMRAAVEAAGTKAQIWAVTLLTSLDQTDIEMDYGQLARVEKIVLNHALMAGEASIRTVTCSAKEVSMLQQALPRMQLAVPGTRSAGILLGDQKRSGTQEQAIADGATFLIIGKEVTEAEDPVSAFLTIEQRVKNPRRRHG